MTSPTTLEELAARVEAATGPDREMDAQIALVCFKALKVSWHDNDSDATVIWENAASPLQRYSASLDAAMTLKPNGFGIYMRWSLKGEERMSADAVLTREVSVPLGEHGHHFSENEVLQADAATLPLAICAACLRVRASMKGTTDHE